MNVHDLVLRCCVAVYLFVFFAGASAGVVIGATGSAWPVFGLLAAALVVVPVLISLAATFEDRIRTRRDQDEHDWSDWVQELCQWWDQ